MTGLVIIHVPYCANLACVDGHGQLQTQNSPNLTSRSISLDVAQFTFNFLLQTPKMRLPGVALLHGPRRPVLLDAARRVGEAQRAGVPPAAQVAQGEGGGGPGHQEVDGEEAEGALLRWSHNQHNLT